MLFNVDTKAKTIVYLNRLGIVGTHAWHENHILFVYTFTQLYSVFELHEVHGSLKIVI